MPTDNTEKKRLIILGGGAAGMLIAMKLANEKKLDITLVDNKSFYEYTPALCSVLYEPSQEKFQAHFNKITYEYEPYLNKLGVKFVLAKIKKVDNEKVYFYHQDVPLEYDYVVICTGSSYANPWKTVSKEDNTFLDRSERLDFLNQEREKYKAAHDILCIGGGPVGVETVAEIASRAPEKKITLVNMSPYVLASAPGGLGKKTQRILEAKKSITLINGERAELKSSGDSSSTRSVYETNKSKTKIEVDLVYNCIGASPNSQFLEGNHADWLDEKKLVKVDDTLLVSGTTNVFALGDINDVKEAKMFYTAHVQAIHFASNMERILKGKEPTPYVNAVPTMVASMGPTFAVAHIYGINLTGWPFFTKQGSMTASLAKHAIEKITMNEFSLKVPVNNILYHSSNLARHTSFF